MLKFFIISSTREVVINRVLASALIPASARWRLLRLVGISLEKCGIAHGLRLRSRKVAVGRGTRININCHFDNYAPVSIGRECSLGMEVLILTVNHQIAVPNRRAGERYGLPVRVGDGCWIGARAVLLPGVHINDGCVIAAGAVVATNCEAHGVYAGTPARRVRNL